MDPSAEVRVKTVLSRFWSAMRQPAGAKVRHWPACSSCSGTGPGPWEAANGAACLGAETGITAPAASTGASGRGAAARLLTA